jgi:hypothetical protein
MNPDLTTIKAAIEASRALESKATGGRWTAVDSGWLLNGEQQKLISQVQGRGGCIRPDDTNFILAARINEPAYREALAVAVEALEDECECQLFRDYTCYSHRALAKIAAMLKEATP